jgi:putative hydroxymethylpyrimidine transporter CytX
MLQSPISPATDAPAWGVEPVPDRLRVLGLGDLVMLWSSLGVSLLVLVIGAFLVPGLSLGEALLAALAGSVIGNVLLGAAGAVGADGRVPAMVLLRAPLGRRGSYAPTTLNVLQCLGWATFELIVIATAAASLSDRLFGFEARWAWTLGFGAVAAALALLGPVSFVRRFVRRFAVYAVAASLVYLTWWALDGGDLSWSTQAEGEGSVWLAIDLVVAVTVSWAPLAADYTRFARSRAAAFVGTGAGYFVAGFWMLALGIVLFLTRDLTDAAALPAAVAAAGVASALALLALTVDETDEAFANIYSTAVSLQNALPRLPQRLLIVGVAAIATTGALVVELRNYETFLLLLGSFFVPLLGVQLADWLARGRAFRPDDFFAAPPFRLLALAAWGAGFLVYHALHDPPLGPSWWVDAVDRVDPVEFGYGATIPSFLVSFVLAGAAALAVERRRAASVAA